MARYRWTLPLVALLLLAWEAHAVPPVGCGERMLGVFTNTDGHRRTVRIAGRVEYAGTDLSGRFRCQDGRNASCPVKSASVTGFWQADLTPRLSIYLSRGVGDSYQTLCTLEGTAPFIFGLYIPALEGTYVCDADGVTESGTFQLVGVHMGRCSSP